MSTAPFVDGLLLTETVVAAMKADGIDAPTPVQEQAIGAVLAGRHVLMHSGTGTGKTLAYLLPVLQLLREGEGRAVVVAPGAELAMQTLTVARAYRDPELTAAAAITTSNPKRERKRLQKSTRLIVGTTDRIADLFATGKLKGMTLLVLDELDPILRARDAGFLDLLLERSEPAIQVVIATATLSTRAEAFVEKHLPDALRIAPAVEPLRDAIAHHVVRVPAHGGKEVALARFIQQRRATPAIVFVSEPRLQSHVFHFLGEHGIKVATLSRERTKQQRQQGLDAFRAGEVKVLICTDATARGLDVPNVDWVLHYDVPDSPQAYIHRAGRTGRAGQKGTSVVFLDPASRAVLRRLERQLPIEFTLLPHA